MLKSIHHKTIIIILTPKEKNHIEILEKNGIKISMNAKGRSTDNIVIERFWRTLKYENVYLKGYSTVKEAREGINQYIEIYNSQRIHSSIGYKTPRYGLLQFILMKCLALKLKIC
jgi:transposase InsO family protein